MSAGSQSALREANTARLLEAVQRFGSLTQVELVESTKLSAATVSTIVKQLLAAGVIETRTTTRSGRRAQLVTLAHNEGLLVGVHVAARSLRIVVSDTRFTTLGEAQLPLRLDHQHDTTLDRVALLIVEQVDALGSGIDEALAIGIGVAAPIDPQTNTVAGRGLLRGWEDIDIAGLLTARLHRPVHVDKDANLGALAEARFGAARGFDDVLYVRASHTTSAGILVGGEIHRGARGTVGEIGHILVDPLGQICRCGSRGCLDTVAGANALIEALRTSMGSVTLTDIVRLAKDGDPGAKQVVEDTSGIIGAHVANLAMTTDPSLVVVGGELAGTGELFLKPIRAALQRRVVLHRDDALEVKAGELGEYAEVKGALAAAANLAHIPRGGQ